MILDYSLQTILEADLKIHELQINLLKDIYTLILCGFWALVVIILLITIYLSKKIEKHGHDYNRR